MKLQEIDENSVKKRPKIGIVGMGNRATSFVNYFSNNSGDAELAALCDLIPEKAFLFKERYDAKAEIFSDVGDMLEKIPLNAIIIATPDYMHVEPAVSALKRGVHVFCEKPMATTLIDCDKITEEAKRSKGIFYLGLNLRHSPVYSTIHEIIASDRLGKISTIESNEYYYGGKTYFRRWNRLRKYGGGLWLTKATHDFDLLNYMTGSEAKTVYATASLSHYKPKPEAAGQCRHCKLQFECPDYYDVFSQEDPDIRFVNQLKLISERNGLEPGDLCLFNSEKDTFDNGMAVVIYENGIRACYNLNVLAARTTRQMRVVGTIGTLEADLAMGKVSITKRHTKKEIFYNLLPQMKSSHGGADDLLIKDFLGAIRMGRKPKTGWDEGKSAVQLSIAARESMDTGKIVNVGETSKGKRVSN